MLINKEQNFDPARDNSCWGCRFRDRGTPDYINICLSDNGECIREITDESDNTLTSDGKRK